MRELVNAVNKTLNHKYVPVLYIFYKDPLLINYMLDFHLPQRHKMTYVQITEDTVAAFMQYANEHFEGHGVVLMNADNYPAEGFDQLKLSYFKERKLMYAISR